MKYTPDDFTGAVVVFVVGPRTTSAALVGMDEKEAVAGIVAH